MSWRNFIGHSRHSSPGVEESIRDHEHLHRRLMQDLKPPNSRREKNKRRSKRENLRLPDFLRAFIFVDAMNLTGSQYDQAISMATSKYTEELT